jgi:hypothetical protein
MTAALSKTLFRIFGHRACCGQIPDWTAHVGQKWDTVDKSPWNLYNIVWRLQTTIREHVN